MRMRLIAPVRNEGTIVVFSAQDDKGQTQFIAVDHRPARDLIEALDSTDSPIFVQVEDWQILGPNTQLPLPLEETISAEEQNFFDEEMGLLE